MTIPAPLIYAIGDIHGCNFELIELLDKISLFIQPQDYLVFMGDYIDIGPDSEGVIDTIINVLATRPNTYALKGDHEHMMLNNSWWMQNGGTETLASYGVTLTQYYNTYNADMYRIMPPAHWTFVNSLSNYLRFGRVVCVHASLNPTQTLAQQTVQWMLYDTTMENYTGTYDDNVFVLHGHNPSYKIRKQTNKMNIDTGCVFDGYLTCAVVDPATGALIKNYRVKSTFGS